jgi:hypothetical protein
MSDRQLYYGSDHKTIGPAEPPDVPEDVFDKRMRLGEGCHFKVDGECHCDSDDWSEYCWGVATCPNGLW